MDRCRARGEVPTKGRKVCRLSRSRLPTEYSRSPRKPRRVIQGKMNESGMEIVGEWTQGGKRFVLKFKRIDRSKVVTAPIPKELEGIWEGKLKLNGGIELRLVLAVAKGKDGGLNASLASPDQGANNIAVSSIAFKGDVLTWPRARSSGRNSRERETKKRPGSTVSSTSLVQRAADAHKDGQSLGESPSSNAEASVPLSRRRRHVH